MRNEKTAASPDTPFEGLSVKQGQRKGVVPGKVVESSRDFQTGDIKRTGMPAVQERDWCHGESADKCRNKFLK